MLREHDYRIIRVVAYVRGFDIDGFNDKSGEIYAAELHFTNSPPLPVRAPEGPPSLDEAESSGIEADT